MPVELKKTVAPFVLVIVLLVFVIAITDSFAFADEGSEGMLQSGDCEKCHHFQKKVIQDWGGKHATEVGCLDCHPQHPPEGENTIAECVQCHQGRPHFQISNCKDCHTDPHKPLAALQDTMKPAREECLSCHSEVGKKMSESTSRHAKLFCTRCHERHGFIPKCMQCHEPHLSSQVYQDCLHCHSAHQPLRIIPAGWIPEVYCKVCHEKESKDLASTWSNHRGVNCIYCHDGQHPFTPSCQKCHGLPHDQLLHSKFRSCLLDCHGDAHRLVSNRWCSNQVRLSRTVYCNAGSINPSGGNISIRYFMWWSEHGETTWKISCKRTYYFPGFNNKL